VKEAAPGLSRREKIPSCSSNVCHYFSPLTFLGSLAIAKSVFMKIRAHILETGH